MLIIPQFKNFKVVFGKNSTNSIIKNFIINFTASYNFPSFFFSFLFRLNGFYLNVIPTCLIFYKTSFRFTESNPEERERFNSIYPNNIVIKSTFLFSIETFLLNGFLFCKYILFIYFSFQRKAGKSCLCYLSK